MSKWRITQVVNLKHRAYTKYIGRGPGLNSLGKFGNPFPIGPNCTRERSVLRHREWLLQWTKHHKEIIINGNRPVCQYSNRWVIEHLEELRGEILGCYCKPLACHGDFLVALLNEDNLVGPGGSLSGIWNPE